MPVLFHKLLTNGLQQPIGLHSARPEFRWTPRPDYQTDHAYSTFTVQLARSHADFQKGSLEWESEPLNAHSHILSITNKDKPLLSRCRYFWRLQGHANNLDEPISEVAWFETGLLEPTDWSAKWVSPMGLGAVKDDAPIYLRKQIQIPEQPVKARVYATACGWYKLFVNGTNITGSALVPRWTPFDNYIEYQAYDITAELQSGLNHISIVVADGRYRGHLGSIEGPACYGDRLEALAQIEAFFDDGSELIWGTDEMWTSHVGPLIRSDPKHGQVVDTTISSNTWLGNPEGRGRFPIDGSVEELPFPSRTLIGEEVQRVEEVISLPCQSVAKSSEGNLILDFGQDVVGSIEVQLRGDPGTRITISYSEVLTPDGKIDLAYVAPRGTKNQPQQDAILLNGEEFSYKPWFGIHGFHFVEIQGLDYLLDRSQAKAIVLSTNFSGVSSISETQIESEKSISALSNSDFRCSNSQLNQLYNNIFWSTLGNFTDTGTDCPMRGLGWTGNIQVFAPTATKFFDTLPFFKRFMKNLAAEQLPDGSVPPYIPSCGSKYKGGLSRFCRATCQSTGWGDAAVIIPWTMYWYYGDVAILEEQYDSMRSWVDSLAKRAREGTSWRRWFFGRVGELEKYILDTGFQWGEWLRAGEGLSSTLVDIVLGSGPAFSTAYLAHSADLLSRICEALGKDTDQQRYLDLFQSTSTAWRAAFVREGGKRIAQDRQDDYVRALAFNLLEPGQRDAAIARLSELVEAADFHLDTGLMSTGMLLPTLADNGRADLAYKILMQKTCPSWLYQIEKGATTTWETWAGYDDKGKAVMSHNHYVLGTVAQWMQEGVAGISPLSAGWKRLQIAPHIDVALDHVDASVEIPFGIVKSSWKLNAAEGVVNLVVDIPPGVQAEILVTGNPAEVVEQGQHSFTFRYYA